MDHYPNTMNVTRSNQCYQSMHSIQQFNENASMIWYKDSLIHPWFLNNGYLNLNRAYLDIHVTGELNYDVCQICYFNKFQIYVT